MKTLLTLTEAKKICLDNNIKWDGCAISEWNYANSNMNNCVAADEFRKLILSARATKCIPFAKGDKVAHVRKNMSGEFHSYTKTGTAAVIWFGHGYGEIAPHDLVSFETRFPSKETMRGWTGVLNV